MRYFWPTRLIDWLGRDRVADWIAESGIPPKVGFFATVVIWLLSMVFALWWLPLYLWRRGAAHEPSAMRPTTAQYFFASPWPGRIWFTAIPSLLALAVGRTCVGFLDPLAAWWDFAQFAWFVLLALLLGFFLAMFPGWLVIGPLFYDREVKNGGPFKVGDRVQILSGPHKGRVSRVYSTWQGNTLRVELGERDKDEFKDIFAPAQLLRDGSAEPSTSPNGGPATQLGSSGAAKGLPSGS